MKNKILTAFGLTLLLTVVLAQETFPPGGGGAGLPADPAACPAGEFVTDTDINGNLSCAVPTDTNAGTICTGTTSYLDGDGGCDTIDVASSISTHASNASAHHAPVTSVASVSSTGNVTVTVDSDNNESNNNVSFVESGSTFLQATATGLLFPAGGSPGLVFDGSTAANKYLRYTGETTENPGAGTTTTVTLPWPTTSQSAVLTEHAQTLTNKTLSTGSVVPSQYLTGTLAQLNTALGSSIADGAHTVDTNTNASTECSGTTTYYDGEGNCDDISGVYLTSEVDGSISNEGVLDVGVGGANSSTITSNTSGSNTITIAGGTNMTVTEAGDTITLSSTASGGAPGLEYTFQGDATLANATAVLDSNNDASGIAWHEAGEEWWISNQGSVKICPISTPGTCSSCTMGNDYEGITFAPEFSETHVYFINEKSPESIFEYLISDIRTCSTPTATRTWDISANFEVGGDNNTGPEGLAFIPTDESSTGGYFIGCTQYTGEAAILELTGTSGSENVNTIADYNTPGTTQWNGLVAVPTGAPAYDCSALDYDSTNGLLYRVTSNENASGGTGVQPKIFVQDLYGNTLAEMEVPGTSDTTYDPEGIGLRLDADEMAITWDDGGPHATYEGLSFKFPVPRWYGPAGGASSTTIAGQSDVTITSADADDMLVYNGSVWVDTAISTCSSGEYSWWDGDSWECATDSGVGGGDDVSVNATAVDDPDFTDSADIEWATTPPAPSANFPTHLTQMVFSAIGTNVSGTQTNFPALVTVTHTSLEGVDCDELIFADGSDNEYYHELRECDNVAGTVTAYVLLPSVTATTGVPLRIYYDDSADGATTSYRDATAVWAHDDTDAGTLAGNGWVGVFHADETSLSNGATITNVADGNSGAGNATLQDEGTENVASVASAYPHLGTALQLVDWDGSDTGVGNQDAVVTDWGQGIEPDTSGLTFSGWFNLTSACSTNAMHFFAVGDDSAEASPVDHLGAGSGCNTNDATNQDVGRCRAYARCNNGDSGIRINGNSAVAGDVTFVTNGSTWYYITMTHADDGNAYLYINGAEDISTALSTEDYAMPWDVVFGGVGDDAQNAIQGVTGYIDELRIHANEDGNQDHLLAWHTSEYNNFTDMATFMGTPTVNTGTGSEVVEASYVAGSIVNADINASASIVPSKLATSMQRESKCAWIEDPTVETFDNILFFEDAATVVLVWCETEASTVDINILNGAGDEILRTTGTPDDLQCTTTGVDACSSSCTDNTIDLTYDNIAQWDKASIDITAIGTTPGRVNVCVTYLVDD